MANRNVHLFPGPAKSHLGAAKDGKHLFLRGAGGVRIWFYVKGKKIVKWAAEDRNGKPVRLKHEHHYHYRRSQKPIVKEGGGKCWLCYTHRNPGEPGSTEVCYEIPCDM